MKKILIAAAFLTTLPASLLIAQEPADTVDLDPLVVTATRIATPRSKVTSSVTVIEGAELQRRGLRTVGEALRLVSGAAVVQNGSFGANTSLFLRGGESDYVQVLVDGVQVNSPGEQFNFSNLALEDIERIEIVKGPASVLYGSDAVTGVVQLFTRQRAGRPAGEVRVAGGRGDRIGAQADGAFNNGFVSGELSAGNESGRYSLGASHFSTQGAYAFNNDHRNTSVTGRGTLRLGSATDVQASSRFTSSRYHYPTDGAGNVSDRNQFQQNEGLALGLGVTHNLARSWTAQLEVQFNQNDATTDDQPDDAADTVGFFSFRSDERFSRRSADLRVNYQVAGNTTLTLGGIMEWQSNRASSSSPFGDSPETTEKRGNKAVYAQWLADWSRLSLQLGARAEDNDKFGSFATYRGGLAINAAPGVRFRASAGTAFKQPRFFEQFAQGFVRGNPSLEPEQSRSIELGGDFTISRATITAAWFDQKFKDLIQYVGLPAGPNDPNYMNVAGAKSSGLELGGTLTFARVLLNGSYTMLDTEVTDEGTGDDPSFAEGEELLRRPRHSASLGATLLFARGNLGATAHYVGERADLDFASFPSTRVTLSSYTRVDVAGELRVNSALLATIKLENALDEGYEEVLGFPSPQRVVYLGARLTLQ